MRSLFAVLRSLTLPAGAQPGSPAIILGPDVPADLQAYYTGRGFPVASAIIYRLDASTYVYEAALAPGATESHARGWSDTGTIYETEFSFFSPPVPANVGFQLGAPGAGIFVTVGLSTRAADRLVEFWRFAQSQTVQIFGGWEVDAVSQSRGRVDRVSSVANTAAIGAETVILTGNSITWKAGRAYEVIYRGLPFASIASNFAVYRIRRNNLAGTLLAINQWEMNVNAVSAQNILNRVIIRNNTAADIIDNIVLTLEATGGGTVTDQGGATFVRYLEIRDCGAASDYPNAIQI